MMLKSMLPIRTIPKKQWYQHTIAEQKQKPDQPPGGTKSLIYPQRYKGKQKSFAKTDHQQQCRLRNINRKSGKQKR